MGPLFPDVCHQASDITRKVFKVAKYKEGLLLLLPTQVFAHYYVKPDSINAEPLLFGYHDIRVSL